ncbi:flagellar hook-length control protein FliK [Devosia sp. A449]
MASHLTVTSAVAGITSSKSLNGAAGADRGARDVFAALVGNAAKPAEATAAAKPEPAIERSPTTPSAGSGGDEAQRQDDPDAIAAVIDAVIPAQAAPETAPLLAEIIDGLADLQARLAAGEPLDAEALKRLDAALTSLSEALGLDLDALPVLGDLAALATDESSFEARLTAALGPIAKSLLDGAATTDATLSAQAKTLGEKLTALLAALNGDDQLTLPDDAELEAALSRLTTPPKPAEPVLATPELKLTEPALTGKGKADIATDPDAEPADAPLKPQPTGTTAEAKPDDRKPVDARPTAVAAAVDTQPEAPVATQSAPAARADIVAAPRVVQAGYQTNQQQLNLPQLAFELVRQVSDGNTRFQIRLDPAELGKIDVRLDIDASGKVNARLTVEKAETLDLMQRDQRGLERALQQAGLDGAKTNLEFSLKQNPFSGGQQDGNGGRSLFDAELAATADEAPPPTVNLYRGNLSASGVNILA